MYLSIRHGAACALALAAAACGEGGNQASSEGSQANAAPVFTSAGAIQVRENSEGAIYRAAAADAEGDRLTFSLAGGADRGLFRMDASGALSLAEPLDFEAPRDANGDNRYEVRLAVSDGRTSAVMDLVVAAANVGPDGYRVRRIASTFVEPIYLAPIPDGSGRVFVVTKQGRIRILNPATSTSIRTPFLDLSDEVSTQGERGLLSMATAPDFARSGIFYVLLTNLQGTIEVRRYRTLAGSRDRADPASGDVILSIPHPRFSNHNGGWIGFSEGGRLFVTVGDGGSGGDPDNNGQNVDTLLGKVLRIDLAGDDFPGDPGRDYRIPPTNPFAQGGGRPEIWAYGLRNPFRASFDPRTRNLWIGDVGQARREEIDVIKADQGGINFGWDIMEGTAPFSGSPRPDLVPPVAEYAHGSGPREGNSVIGGYVYRGPVEALRGQYFFGDFVTGNLWSIRLAQVRYGSTLPASAFRLRNADFAPDQGTIDNISSFGVDQAGNLYIVDFDGEVFRIEPS